MIDLRSAARAAIAAVLSLAMMQLASASNFSPEPHPEAGSHQELMTFLLRGPATTQSLAGRHIAVVLVNGADAVTFELARDYLVEQGAAVDVLTARTDVLLHTYDYAGNDRLVADAGALDAKPANAYDAIYLPGRHPDAQAFEADPQVARYVSVATAAGKPVFAMGDAVITLARANLLRGRHATASKGMFTFLAWSGAEARDEALVRDDLIYTSRDAYDLPRMMLAIEQLLAAAH
jgi:putative intracellular protease/amidase